MEFDREFEAALDADAEKLTEMGADPGDHTANVIREIDLERRRQFTKEGYSRVHDDGYAHGELVLAAICYAREAGCAERPKPMHGLNDPARAPSDWPWDVGYWKPKDQRRDLVRACALLVAEIERLDRNPETAT